MVRRAPTHLLAIVIQCGLTYWFAGGGTEPGQVTPWLMESDNAMEIRADQTETLLDRRGIVAEEIQIINGEASLRPFVDTSVHLAVVQVGPEQLENLRQQGAVPLDRTRVHENADSNLVFSLLAQHNA
jgi:hypothetical protein